MTLHAKRAPGGRKNPFAKARARALPRPMSDSPLAEDVIVRLRTDGEKLAPAFRVAEGDLTPEFYARLAAAFVERDLVRVSLLATARPKRAALIAHLVKHGDCTYVGLLGRDALLHRAAPPARP